MTEARNSIEARQGLLDIAVELSTSDLIAGYEFSVYVLVKNPYDLPVWIRSVTVSVPSEIELPQWSEAKYQAEQQDKKLAEESTTKEKQQESSIQKLAETRVKTHAYQERLAELERQIQTTTDKAVKTRLQEEIYALRVEIEKGEIATNFQESNLETDANIHFNEGTEINSLEIADFSKLNLHFRDTKVGELRVGQKIKALAGREVDLASSLPSAVPLQPGDTAVYTVIFRTKSKLLFRPTQYKLHFNVAYHFGKAEQLRVNTVSANLSIRAAISAIMVGALLGGLAGFIARQLQVLTSIEQMLISGSNLIFPLLLSLILSSVSVVFIARKSETQSFVSVEDFWGGVLMGFLVGYSGVAAFQSITGVKV